ncbi:MAG: YkgJ family cysteine cluster protein [Spirochaetaceae bacterium]|nr:MAG: YkgJ family cysteine cluster protein [Spirochaetaceae bacterium]
MNTGQQGSGEYLHSNGLRFECNRCSHCCRHDPGLVFLAEEDIVRIPQYLRIGRAEFLARYCRNVDIGTVRRITIDERPNYDCVFWSENGCEIYEVRPLQCRSYPFWASVVESVESWQAESEHCPGINTGTLHSSDEIDDWLHQARLRRLIELDTSHRGG